MATTGRCVFNSVSSPDTGPNINWNNLSDALASGGLEANLELLEEEYSEVIYFSSPDFPAVPSGSTNIQVYIYVDRHHEAGSGRVIVDNQMQLTLSGTPVGSDLAGDVDWDVSLREDTYGPAWGFTPTVGQLASIGVAMQAYSDSTRECEAYIDFVEIEVTYDPPSGPAAQEFIQYN